MDGEGGFVFPGLADMHVHVWEDHELPLFVAHGVTLVRNMWGTEDTLALRQRVQSGEVFGPTILTTGPMIDGPPAMWEGSAVAATPDEGRALVDAHVEAGYDFIKVYSNLAPDTFEAIAARSRERGIPFVGHVPRRVPMGRALESGMASIEHLEGYRPATFADDSPIQPGPPNFAVITEVMGAIERRERPWSDVFSADKRDAVARSTAEHAVWSVPTLVFVEQTFTPREGVAAQLERPEMRWIHPTKLARWSDPDSDFRLAGFTDEQIRLLGSISQEQRREVAALHDAGARILVGTDTANPFVVPGLSVHEELALLVQSGMSSYEALTAATRGPAEFLGLSDRGTIAVGQVADLVVVRRDPLTDITATRDISGIVLAGQWHDVEALTARLDAVAADFPEPAPPAADTE